MANLPDINTANVGIIGFWNAHDHRVSGTPVIDPTDCISIFSSYTVYDNGIDGYVDPNAKGWGGSGRRINLRVKNDGWIVAYVDRTNTYGRPNKVAADFGESGYKGYYDILWDWFDETANISATQTTLSNMIYRCYDVLSNKADFTFADADVGHYCYEFTNANVITLTNLIRIVSGYSYGYIQYTTGTTLYYAAVASSSATGYESWFEGHNITMNLVTDPCVGSADIIAEGWMPTPLTDYELKITANNSSSILVIWK